MGHKLVCEPYNLIQKDKGLLPSYDLCPQHIPLTPYYDLCSLKTRTDHVMRRGRRWNGLKLNTVIIGKLCPKISVPDSFDFGFHLHCCFFKICKSQDKLNKDIDFIIAFSTHKMKFVHLVLITVPSLLIAHWCVARSISSPFSVSLLLDNTSHINDFKFASSCILKMRSRKIILVTCFI